MLSRHLHSGIVDRPDVLLALSLSAPAEGVRRVASVNIDFETDGEVTARVRAEPRGGPRVLASKQTILEAILLLGLIEERDWDYADTLVAQAEKFAAECARVTAQDRNGERWPLFNAPGPTTADFLKTLNVDSATIADAQTRTVRAFDYLEAENLAIDPGFIPELVVLSGLIPVQFSVRTPRGERVYREIKLHAGLWSLDLELGHKRGRKFVDFDFRLRGVQIVRKLLTTMATQYLEEEELQRRSEKKPVLRRIGRPELD